MPGMMDTILNLGLNETTLAALIRHTGNERFGYDAYRRFIQLFGKVALGVPDTLFDEQFEAVKDRAGVKVDVGLGPDDLREIGERFLEVVRHHTGRPFPVDPYEQLEIAIKAVFGSWLGKRAIDYRREFGITPAMANGTAVNVVTMVFGNMGNDSATGVGFTRNPATGENQLYGEYLVNAQGEDVVAGIRTPRPIQEMEREMPEMYRQLVDLRNRLERHYREVQDFEFTIERGTLYCLQTRNGKMNAASMVRTSVEMHEEGLLTREQAITRVNPAHLEQMLFPRLDPKHKAHPDRGRPPRLAWSRQRPGRVRRRPGRGPGPQRRQGHPGARGDQAGGHPRLLRVTGHPDQPGRQDVACRGRRARHGQALRGRRRGHPRRRADAGRLRRRPGHQGGRRHHDRR